MSEEAVGVVTCGMESWGNWLMFNIPRKQRISYVMAKDRLSENSFSMTKMNYKGHDSLFLSYPYRRLQAYPVVWSVCLDPEKCPRNISLTACSPLADV